MEQFLSFLWSNYGAVILLYIPLGAVGLWRWIVFCIKVFFARVYTPTPPSTVSYGRLSLVVPVYNEQRDMLVRAIESWLANNPYEIVAIVDSSDTEGISVIEGYQKRFPDICRMIITDEPGKRSALARGITTSSGELIALVDSDTIWESNILATLLSPFADPAVGGVAPRQSVLEARTLAQKLYAIQLDNRYDVEMRFLDAAGDAITCISGRTAVYRREAIVGHVDHLVQETFAGHRSISGDDKSLTRFIQADGWKVRYQDTALVYTSAAADLGTYLKQRIRWTRNSWRSDLLSLKSRWIWKREPVLALHMIDRMAQPFVMLLGPFTFLFFIIDAYYGPAFILFAWWFVTRSIKVAPSLQRRPALVSAIPAYIFFSFLLAVIKIYALFSVTKQGWKTRWSLHRLGRESLKAFARTTALPLAFSAAVLFGVSELTYAYLDIVTTASINQNTFVAQELGGIEYGADRRAVEQARERHTHIGYEVRPRDTFVSLARRYNIDPVTLIQTNPESAIMGVRVGTTMQIPIAALQDGYERADLQAQGTPIVTYTEPVPPAENKNYIRDSNILTVAGPGAVVTVPSLFAQLETQMPGQQFLVEREPGVWELSVSLLIGDDVLFIIDGKDVQWLRMKSQDDQFVWMVADGGALYITDTKITSWNFSRQAVDEEEEKYGRSFILAKDNSRMDIANSELAYLGYASLEGHLRGSPFGGIYGVSWRITTGTFGRRVATGSLRNSRIHHNHFGLYTYGATGIRIENNEVYENTQYGIDPHDDSNAFIIRGNVVHHNGNHGIIVSKRCFYNDIVENFSFLNEKHGIMIDQDSDGNLVARNEVYGNIDGVVIYSSRLNIVTDNILHDQEKSGIRVNASSSRNYIENNLLSDNRWGVYLYGDTTLTYADRNVFEDNEIAWYLRDTTRNILRGSIFVGNDREIKFNGGAQNNYFEDADTAQEQNNPQ